MWFPKYAGGIFFVKTCLTILLCTSKICIAQTTPVNSRSSISNLRQANATGFSFIENTGQYNKIIPGQEKMGSVLYGYEGLDMPVLFTKNGLLFLQRKIKKLSRREEEKLERQGVSEAEIERKRVVTDRVITQMWMGANPDVQIVAEDRTTDYHTYGHLNKKAFGYKSITYKNMYPGIDIVYNFNNNNKIGFEYSLVVQPGADLSVVRLKFEGDVKKIKIGTDGALTVSSDINGISTSLPVSYYSDRVLNKNTADLRSAYKISGNEINFYFPEGYDKTKTLVIDPFVTATTNLSGVNSGKAKDVDFDYAGNVYVTGGGDGSQYKLAKYNAAGILQWTFNGSTTNPAWTFGPYYGGWVVDKNSGNIYLGQGFNPTTGYQVVRISTTGLYDNYISAGNTAFNENWKMYWNCNNGSPRILVVGGGTSSNLNLGILTPPSTNITPLNLTGIGSVCQDMVDMVLDPTTNDIYTLFASLFVTPAINDKIYKNIAPYSAATISWNVPSGFTVVQEAGNRPYMAPNFATYDDNSANMLSLNASYLYYWDGKNLKAFDKATGAAAGTTLVTANTAKMQGGIIADACNNIFVGEGNGVIKVYKFNGSIFDDAAAPDITIPGFNGKAVYDLAYDESRKLIYASGDGFVGSFDVSAYCPTTTYTLNIVPNCLTASAVATVSPAPASGSVITYTLFNGATQLAVNTTGIFGGLSPNITYTIVATINLACSGTQATNTFTVPGPTVGVSSSNTTCGANTGTITATGSGTAGPYSYSIDGTNFFPSGNFTGLGAGVYTVTVQDVAGCRNTAVVIILNSNGPSISYTQTNADCGNNNGTVTASVTGGTAPYQYSINGTTFQTGNFFTGLIGGTYTLTVKDANNCINVALVNISSTPAPSINAIPASATCGSNNGTITAFGSGGTGALEYSINGNIFQPGNVFINLVPGVYTVTVRDVNHCTGTTTVTIPNSPAPSVTATATSALCNNVNGTITANGSGGLAPLQYSINGITFQPGNIFTGLAAGAYTVTVRDASGCTNIVGVTVASVGGPTASATSTVSACNVNTGSITITGSGGLPGYQYSINGSTFQAGNTFNALGAGNYVAFVKDANGCIGTFSIAVGNTAGPSISASGAPTSCNINDGIITITASGGTPGYQYSIDGSTYVAGFIFSGLASGNYIAYVKDANGCVRSANVFIANVSGLSFTVSTIVTSCGTNNGSITATATGGAAPLQYSIDGTSYQASNIFTGLSAANYTVYVKDANGCIVTRPAIIGTVSGPSLSVTIQQQATCGTASGVIRATGSGGLAPLTYNIDGGAFQPIGIFIVAAGLHTILVKDATGCLSPSQSVTITTSGAGVAVTDVTFTVNGVLACTGEGKIKNIKGVPSGGGNHYVFSLDGGAFTTANQFRPVSIGTHTLTAKNDDGCTFTKLVSIGTGVPATATATSTSTLCNASTGTITINGVGANTPYHASIDGSATWNTFFPPGANSFTFTGLSSGTHSITMADDADFTAGSPDIPGACLTTIFVVVPSIGGPTISTTQINPTCTANNGSITAVGGSSAGPYTYNIDGGAYFPSGVFNNLAPGVHAVTVKDGAGCITGANVTLSNAAVPTLTAAIQPASCNLFNGSITASATGGTAPLQYSINGTIFQSSNIFNNLAPGSYTLYVKDATECYTTLPVTIANTSLPLTTAFTIAASCNNNDGSIVASGTGGTQPYTFSINGTVYQSSGTFSNLAAGFYTVYIKDARDCITTTGVSVVNAGGPQITAISSTAATCADPTGTITVTASGGGGGLEYSIDGTTFQTLNIFTGLLPATYVITVRDINGCLNTRAVTVANTPGPQTLTAVITDAACGFNNGSITATASGGTGALQYSIDGTAWQAGNVFTGLFAGGYTLYVRDVNLCVKTLPVLLINLAGPNLTANATDASCGLDDGTITANATGGTGVLSYSKNGILFQSSNIFTGLAANTYTITVKDARGCIDSVVVTVNANNTTFNGTLAAVAGGIQRCKTAAVAVGGTSYFDPLCTLISRVVPSGASPVSGPISNCVIIDPSIQVFNAEPYVQRHYDIEPAVNANNATATITLYFRDEEFVAFNANNFAFPDLPTLAGGGNADPNIGNLRVTQYHGVPIAPHNVGNPSPGYYTNSSGVQIVPTSVNYNSTYNFWEVTFPVNGFSGFYVHSNLFFPLPVTLNYFTGTKQGSKHLLNWKVTLNAVNGAVFSLERSGDALNFTELYALTADATRCQQPFDHTDADPLPGLNYYRLKMTTSDGKVTYSNVVALLNDPKGFDIMNIVPNPVTNGYFKLGISSNEAADMEIIITDMQGRIADRRSLHARAGLNSIDMNVGKLASGTYFISADKGSAKSRVMRFVKE